MAHENLAHGWAYPPDPWRCKVRRNRKVRQMRQLNRASPAWSIVSDSRHQAADLRRSLGTLGLSILGTPRPPRPPAGKFPASTIAWGKLRPRRGPGLDGKPQLEWPCLVGALPRLRRCGHVFGIQREVIPHGESTGRVKGQIVTHPFQPSGIGLGRLVSRRGSKDLFHGLIVRSPMANREILRATERYRSSRGGRKRKYVANVVETVAGIVSGKRAPALISRSKTSRIALPYSARFKSVNRRMPGIRVGGRLRIQRAFQPLAELRNHGGIRARHARRRHLAGFDFAKHSFEQLGVVGGVRGVQTLQNNPGRLHLDAVASRRNSAGGAPGVAAAG